MTGPDARTTQIYINTGDQSRQDADGFAPFGKVVEGMDVVDSLYSEYAENSGGGMRAGRQGKLFEEGNVYLDREFPLLDKLIRATILAKRGHSAFPVCHSHLSAKAGKAECPLFVSALRTADPQLLQELQAAYDDAKAKGRFKDQYADQHHRRVLCGREPVVVLVELRVLRRPDPHPAAG